MRRPVAGQLALAAYPVRDGDGSIVVPKPSGVAAQDAAWIQAAHDLLDATRGGRVRLREGTYVLNPSNPLAFTKYISFQGEGYESTILTLDSATANAITSAKGYCVFEDFQLLNNHATTPTAGAGILVGTTGGGDHNQFHRVWVSGFYTGIDHQYGGGWNLSDSRIWQYTVGVKIQNLDSLDGGDMSIHGCYFLSDLAADHIGVEWLSAGGLRFLNNKINSDTANTHSPFGVFLDPQSGVASGDALIVGNSIEGVLYGVDVVSGGGTLQNIVVTGNQIDAEQFASTSGSACVRVFPSSTGKISKVLVGQNILSGAQYGIYAGNVANLVHGPNLFASIGVSNFGDAGGNTNVTSVGTG